MKQFEIPAFYKSDIISKVKAFRKENDPRKKDFSPTLLDFGSVQLYIARHFGFCYGVENAIEIAYKALDENPGKNIYLLSQMIHNPAVNEDLVNRGMKFIQDTSGKQLISWDDVNANDIVIIPAFGTTLEIEQLLLEKGIEIQKYNTTCPFVEKVWNRSEKLGSDEHTLVIHGKYNHEETRATFSHAASHTHAVIVKDMAETRFLADVIEGHKSPEEFYAFFKGKYTDGFDPKQHLDKIGVINQTTMLATETQEISEFLRNVIESQNSHKTVADTRDTLCYATNDNQSATYGLMDVDLDFSIVVGGYNSSNTTHLVELLEQKAPCYFIKDSGEMLSENELNSFDIHQGKVVLVQNWNHGREIRKIGITSGASCPDVLVDQVIHKLLGFSGVESKVGEVLSGLLNASN